MGEVRKSSYRLPPTPKGIKAIERGDLDYFEPEIWDNLNTGLLEEYLEEKNRRESFDRSTYDWVKVGIGIFIGTLFAIITQYVGLKVGLAVSGSWYVAYLIGIAGKWRPSELNIATGASTGATYISTGFIFTFPAMYLLSAEEVSGRYVIGVDPTTGGYIYLINDIPAMFVALVATIIAGFLGVLYFIIFRRIWLVDDPLHVPGIEAQLQLLEMSKNITSGAAEKAQHAMRLILGSSIITGIFTFLKDFPVEMDGKDEPLMDHVFGGDDMSEWYNEGIISQPLEHSKYTWVNFGLIPIEVGIGWFMRFRVALLVSLGTLITWFLIIPMAVVFDVPIYDPRFANPYPITQATVPALIGYARIARFIAIGAILGGGITALIKNAPIFKTILGDLKTAMAGNETDAGSYIEGKGWYEWPLKHIYFMAIFAFFSIGLVFSTEFSIVPSFVFAFVLAITTFFLGAIAVKVMGETGTEPVSGTSFIVLLILVIIFKYVLGLPKEETAIMAIIGTTVFGGAISMSGDIIFDFKAGLYIGNRPYHLMKGELTGIVPGAIVSVIGAAIFGKGLADGTLDLPAPQAHAFATVLQLLFSDDAFGFIITLLVIGILIGVWAELATGMGTAFGLGMYFPLYVTTPILLGGFLRDMWEMFILERDVVKFDLTDQEKTMRRLDTYMLATGLIVGEAIAGTIIAIYLVSFKG
jgi:uncharacterized oligopeptide transporter (OPT) family protein